MQHQPNNKNLNQPLGLAKELIKCASVTPEDGGAIDCLTIALESIGFKCHPLLFTEPNTHEIKNLYAKIGNKGKNFCYAGHTDVVPVGGGWTVDPFSPQVIKGYLYGRGATDMKGSIACFVAAVSRFLEQHGPPPGIISLMITGDEEGPAINGTKKILNWLQKKGEKLDACIVGEPTNPTKIGETIKIGRRGSLNGKIKVLGTQGHVAYPHQAQNPIPIMIKLLNALTKIKLDEGNNFFQPSCVVITSVDVGNNSTNIIPNSAEARFNIRFNDHHTGQSLKDTILDLIESNADGITYKLEMNVSGEPFITKKGDLTNLVSQSINEILGTRPELSTTGGTSDARFIYKVCPVCEFGMTSLTMHQSNEKVALSDLEKLTQIYLQILKNFFLSNPR